MWRPEFVRILHGYLSLQSGMRAVDFGSGTGFATRLAASKIGPKGQLVCIDQDRNLLTAGKKLAHRERLMKTIHMVQGDAYIAPLPLGWADLAMCQGLLSNVTHPLKIIAEMTRVVKKGGMVAAIEPVGMKTLVDPEDEALTRLQLRSWNAYREGSRRLLGEDKDIGFKLPSLFLKVGLTDIQMDGYLETILFCDDRYNERDLMRFLKDRFIVNSSEANGKSTAEMVRDLSYGCGGMAPAEARRIRKKLVTRLRPLIRNMDKLRGDASVLYAARVIVRGRKR